MHIVNDQLDHWRLINTDAPCTASHEEKIQLANITGCLINTEDTPYQLEAKTTKTFTGVTGPYAKEIEAIVSWKDNRDVSQSLIFYFTASVYRHS